MKLTYTELVEGIYNPFSGRDTASETTVTATPITGTSTTSYTVPKTALDQIKDRVRLGGGMDPQARGVPEDKSEEWVKGMAGFKGSSNANTNRPATSNFYLDIQSNSPVSPITGRRMLGPGMTTRGNPASRLDGYRMY